MIAPVEIALATFNGNRFLADLLASIERQSHACRRIFVRDDCSHDDTVATLRGAIANELPLTLLPSPGGRLGASNNFNEILHATIAPYVALCDQDDIWFDAKVERLHSAVQEAESRLGNETPILACSDLSLIDEGGRYISNSYWNNRGYDPKLGSTLSCLLVMNCFPGCSMMVNRALLKIALPIPPDAVMHDWWLAQVASAAGRLIIVREPLAGYRIHSANAVGIPQRSPGTWLQFTERREEVRNAMVAAVTQAKSLHRRLSGQIDAGHEELLRAFCALDGKNWLGKRWTLIHNHICKHGLLRHINMLLHI